MATEANGNYSLERRRAVEALRNGVPNREAVSILGCNQPQAERRFAELLERTGDQGNPPSNALGMLVSGDFGSGKSHLLTYLEHQALAEGFVCSKVAISKETPLYDLSKVFKSAVESGQAQNRKGRLIEELGQQLDYKSNRYADFFRWAKEAAAPGVLSSMFPASLLVHERSDAEGLDLKGDIENFWAGDRSGISAIRKGLRQIGEAKNYSFRAPRAVELPPQRLRFFVELIKAAGYQGWVVLLDEIELVASYSLLQRGRSYSELTRWLGQATGDAYPGLVVVGTVTDDFAAEVISPDGEKKDRDYAGARLASRYGELVARAETGMRLLERECTPLNLPTDQDVQRTVEELRQIYSAAYGWDAPPLPADAGGAGYRNRMRYKVRAAINRWDLLRLYPDARPDTQFDEFRHTYEENPDLERESREDEGDDG